MTQQNLITGLVITASLVVAFLLGQSDLELPPIVKVALGAMNVALTYWARVSNGGAAVTTLTTSAPTAVTFTPPSEPPPPSDGAGG